MTDEQAAFQQRLFEQIPQTKHLGIKISRMTEDCLVMQGDFALNKNHLNIVFGGSIAAISITTAWSFLQHRIVLAGLNGALVIKQQTVKFLLPIRSEFECIASLHANEDWAPFLTSYRQRGRARIQVNAQLQCEGKTCATFEGTFVLYQPSESAG